MVQKSITKLELVQYIPLVWQQAATAWWRPDSGVGGLMQLMGANQRRELQDIAVPSLSL